jgi:hypothetical protein
VKPGVPHDQARAELRVIDRDRIEEIAKRGDLKWLKVTIDAVPACGHVEAHVRVREAAVRADGDRFRAAAAGVHQRGGPPPGAWRRSFARDGRASVARRRPLRLVRQVLTESLLLAAAGCLLGTVLAYFGADALMRS